VATDEMRGRLQGVFIVVVAGGPRIGDVLHGAAAASVGTAAAAAGGGVLVVIGVSIAALALPAFIRYRVGAIVGSKTVDDTVVDNGSHGSHGSHS
jgi:hypothetical protein